MKNHFAKMFVAGVLAVMAFDAGAQLIPNPANQAALSIPSGGYLIPGSTTTNIPTASAPIVSFGGQGLGVFVRVGATNAATTTNATMVLEQVYYDINSGTVHVVDSSATTINVSFAQNGTTGYDYYTNIANTVANLPNSQFRIRSVQNTNLASIWISNAVYRVRE